VGDHERSHIDEQNKCSLGWEMPHDPSLEGLVQATEY